MCLGSVSLTNPIIPNVIRKLLLSWIVGFSSICGLFAESENERRVLSVAKLLPCWNADQVVIEKLSGGLTNDNYKGSCGSVSYFFRCNNVSNTVLGASFEREWLITKIVSESKIAPQIVLYSADEGVLVTEFIKTSGKPVNLRDDETLQKFCRTMYSVHHLDVLFPSQFCPLQAIFDYADKACELGVRLPEELSSNVFPWINRLKESELMHMEKRPTHLDLWSGNILDDGKELWLIDWEYAAMGDPFFDLATLASVENFSDQEMEKFLRYYLLRQPSKLERHHFYCMRILADTRWALWSYLQVKLSPPGRAF